MPQMVAESKERDAAHRRCHMVVRCLLQGLCECLLRVLEVTHVVIGRAADTLDTARLRLHPREWCQHLQRPVKRTLVDQRLRGSDAGGRARRRRFHCGLLAQSAACPPHRQAEQQDRRPADDSQRAQMITDSCQQLDTAKTWGTRHEPNHIVILAVVRGFTKAPCRATRQQHLKPTTTASYFQPLTKNSSARQRAQSQVRNRLPYGLIGKLPSTNWALPCRLSSDSIHALRHDASAR